MQEHDFEAAIIEQGKQITELNANVKAAFKRIDEQKALTETVQELAFSVRDLIKTQEQTDASVKRLREDMDDIKGKPAKRWDAIIGALIAAAVAFVAGRVLQ